MPKPPDVPSPSIKCLVGRTRVYLVLAVVVMVALIGADISSEYGVVVGASTCAVLYLLITLLCGDGALLLLSTTIVGTLSSSVEVVLAATSIVGFLLAAGFVTGGVLATFCGLAIGGLGLLGLLAVGYHQQQLRRDAGFDKAARRRAVGS